MTAINSKAINASEERRAGALAALEAMRSVLAMLRTEEALTRTPRENACAQRANASMVADTVPGASEFAKGFLTCFVEYVADIEVSGGVPCVDPGAWRPFILMTDQEVDEWVRKYTWGSTEEVETTKATKETTA